jgi:deoxycytidylate deaminase
LLLTCLHISTFFMPQAFSVKKLLLTFLQVSTNILKTHNLEFIVVILIFWLRNQKYMKTRIKVWSQTYRSIWVWKFMLPYPSSWNLFLDYKNKTVCSNMIHAEPTCLHALLKNNINFNNIYIYHVPCRVRTIGHVEE